MNDLKVGDLVCPMKFKDNHVHFNEKMLDMIGGIFILEGCHWNWNSNEINYEVGPWVWPRRSLMKVKLKNQK